jgi:hypothetical protein
VSHNPPSFDWRPEVWNGRRAWRLSVNRRPCGTVVYCEEQNGDEVEGYYMALFYRAFLGHRWSTLDDAKGIVETAWWNHRASRGLGRRPTSTA